MTDPPYHFAGAALGPSRKEMRAADQAAELASRFSAKREIHLQGGAFSTGQDKRASFILGSR